MRTLLSLTLISLLTLSYCQTTEAVCQTSADCPGSKTCEENVCVRQDLFPLNGKEVLGTFLSVTINILLNIGGVGGGAVHIPYIHYLYETTIQKAVTISYACVFGGSIGYVLYMVPARDSTSKRFLVNYDIALITLPALMIGVGFGTIVSKLLSPLATGIIIIFVLGYAILKSAFKFKEVFGRELLAEHGRKVYQCPDVKLVEEVKPEVKPKIVRTNSIEPVIMAAPSIQEVMSKNDLPDQEQETVKDFKRRSLPASTTIIASATTFDRTYSRVLSILVKDNVPLANKQTEKQIEEQIEENAEEEGEKPIELIHIDTVAIRREHLTSLEENFPVKKFLSLLVNILSIVIFGLIRGTTEFKPIFGVKYSLSWDFIWFGLGTFCFILATTKSIYDVLKSQKEKQEAKYVFLPQEPVLNKQRLIALLIRAVVGGFVSAVSTLAGALILGPALLNMGMPATFATVTTNIILILSMFNTMLGILLTKSLSIQEVAWFMLFSCLFSMLVTKCLKFYVKKTGKESTIVGLVVIGTVIGAMCLISTGMQSMMDDMSAHVKFGTISSN